MSSFVVGMIVTVGLFLSSAVLFGVAELRSGNMSRLEFAGMLTFFASMVAFGYAMNIEAIRRLY